MTSRTLAPLVVVFCVLFMPHRTAQAETGNAGVRDPSGAVRGVTVKPPARPDRKGPVGRHRQPGPLPHRRSTARAVRRYLHLTRLQHLQAGRHRIDDRVHRDCERGDANRRARGNDHGHRRGLGCGRPECDAADDHLARSAGRAPDEQTSRSIDHAPSCSQRGRHELPRCRRCRIGPRVLRRPRPASGRHDYNFGGMDSRRSERGFRTRPYLRGSGPLQIVSFR